MYIFLSIFGKLDSELTRSFNIHMRMRVELWWITILTDSMAWTLATRSAFVLVVVCGYIQVYVVSTCVRMCVCIMCRWYQIMYRSGACGDIVPCVCVTTREDEGIITVCLTLNRSNICRLGYRIRISAWCLGLDSTGRTIKVYVEQNCYARCLNEV